MKILSGGRYRARVSKTCCKGREYAKTKKGEREREGEEERERERERDVPAQLVWLGTETGLSPPGGLPRPPPLPPCGKP